MAMAARGQVSWDRSGLDVDVMVVRNLDHSVALVTCRGLPSLPFASVLFNSLPRYGTGQVVSQNISLRKVRLVTGAESAVETRLEPTVSNLDWRIVRIRSRSEGEHRDCEMLTRSAGSGIPTSWDSSRPCST